MGWYWKDEWLRRTKCLTLLCLSVFTCQRGAGMTSRMLLQNRCGVWRVTCSELDRCSSQQPRQDSGQAIWYCSPNLHLPLADLALY